MSSSSSSTLAPPSRNPAEAAAHRNVFMALLASARPKQWVKNLFVLAPVAFATPHGSLTALRMVSTLVAFCLAASGLYLINDIADRELDRQHERKRLRPIASGQLDIRTAAVAATLALVTALPLALFGSVESLGLLGGYIALTLAYSWGLKHVVVLDVMLIATGFVIRVAAGSYAAGFAPTDWLLICTGFLALFLGFGKRRSELVLLGGAAGSHRPNLDQYTEELLDQFLSASTMGAIISYSLYAITSEAAQAHKSLVLTVPFVVYAIFRYSLLVHNESAGGAPEELLLKDRSLQIAIVLWGFTAFLVVYWHRIF